MAAVIGEARCVQRTRAMVRAESPRNGSLLRERCLMRNQRPRGFPRTSKVWRLVNFARNDYAGPPCLAGERSAPEVSLMAEANRNLTSPVGRGPGVKCSIRLRRLDECGCGNEFQVSCRTLFSARRLSAAARLDACLHSRFDFPFAGCESPLRPQGKAVVFVQASGWL